MRYTIPSLLAAAVLAVAFTEISRIVFNNYVVDHCGSVYAVVYTRGVAACRSAVQVIGPANPIKD
jgi:hypothetical protein